MRFVQCLRKIGKSNKYLAFCNQFRWRIYSLSAKKKKPKCGIQYLNAISQFFFYTPREKRRSVCIVKKRKQQINLWNCEKSQKPFRHATQAEEVKPAKKSKEIGKTKKVSRNSNCKVSIGKSEKNAIGKCVITSRL